MKRTSNRRTALMRAKTATRKTATRKTSKPKSPPAKSSRAKPSRDKVRAHRARMRKRGFRLVQMWLPDTRTKEFSEQAHKDSLAIANSPTEAEDQAFVDSVSSWNSEEARELEKREPPTPWWRTEGKSD